VFDPIGMDEARKLIKDVEWCSDAYATLPGADCLVLITEWNEFRALDLDRVRDTMKSPVMVDLRNVYAPADMAKSGFHYHSIGRPAVHPVAGATQ
jgi:UDPglucose 6-dehydrogenase